jgi:hypothetical protein
MADSHFQGKTIMYIDGPFLVHFFSTASDASEACDQNKPITQGRQDPMACPSERLRAEGMMGS